MVNQSKTWLRVGTHLALLPSSVMRLWVISVMVSRAPASAESNPTWGRVQHCAMERVGSVMVEPEWSPTSVQREPTATLRQCLKGSLPTSCSAICKPDRLRHDTNPST